MNKDLVTFISARCNAALMESEEYTTMEHDKETEPEDLQALAEEICYRKGAMDMLSFITNDTQKM